jgi:GNAT superfamily N-acetyltransferase
LSSPDSPSPSSAIQAIEANQWALWATVCGDDFHEENDLAWYLTGIPFPPFNGVVKARLQPDTLEKKIEEMLELYRLRNLPMCWWVGPASSPDDLGEHLESHGLTLEDRAPGMAVDLGLLKNLEPTKEVKIERVSSKQIMAGWTRVLTSVFGIPVECSDACFEVFDRVGYALDVKLWNYVGILGDRIVAISTVFLDGDVAGVYNVATMPDARGKGIGAAMSLAPLLAARERGCRLGILQSSPMGYGVYKGLGFQEYCKIDLYMSKF